MGVKCDVYLLKKGNIIFIGIYFNFIGEEVKNELWNIWNFYNENWKIIFFLGMFKKIVLYCWVRCSCSIEIVVNELNIWYISFVVCCFINLI